MTHAPSSLTEYVSLCRQKNELIVQPRMGFSDLETMGKGLEAVTKISKPTIGTITLDSYTRVNNFSAIQTALKKNKPLNGFPIVNLGSKSVKEFLNSLNLQGKPVQVRHGAAQPERIFKSMLDAGITATEGGPVSYCLPYSNVSLDQAFAAWKRCCDLLKNHSDKTGKSCHLETFAGSMMGQLCPPALLLALNILEALFFKSCGLQDISLSYTQGTHKYQDLAAMSALKMLGQDYLQGIHWHIVFYTFMGMFPQTKEGAYNLIGESAAIARMGRADRLIVKTTAEAFHVPTIEDNLNAITLAHAHADTFSNDNFPLAHDALRWEIYTNAKYLIDCVLDIHPEISKATLHAFDKGYLDIPYCLHKNNHNKTTCFIDEKGFLQWGNIGSLLLPKQTQTMPFSLSSSTLIDMLSYIQRKFDRPYLSLKKSS